MNHKQIVQLLSVITDLYPSTRFSETADETWLKVLGPYPAPAVVSAFDRLARTSPTFPPNAYQIAAALDAVLSDEKPAEVIWAGIVQIVRTVGNPDHRTRALCEIAAIDPLAAEVIDTGITWHALAGAPTERMEWLFRDFRDGLAAARAERGKAATREQLTAGPDPWPGPLPMRKPDKRGPVPISAIDPGIPGLTRGEAKA